TPNGQLSANVGGNTTDFTFTWFAGSGTTGTVVSDLATPHTASALPAGTYTVRAVNVTTGCTSTVQTTVTNNLVIPVIATNIDQQLTRCDINNGQLSANVGGNTTDFTFYW